jgi:hypothetical protein
MTRSGFFIHDDAFRYQVLNSKVLEKRAHLEAAMLNLKRTIEAEIPLGSQLLHLNRNLVELFDQIMRAIVFHDDGRLRTPEDL